MKFGLIISAIIGAIVVATVWHKLSSEKSFPVDDLRPAPKDILAFCNLGFEHVSITRLENAAGDIYGYDAQEMSRDPIYLFDDHGKYVTVNSYFITKDEERAMLKFYEDRDKKQFIVKKKIKCADVFPVKGDSAFQAKAQATKPIPQCFNVLENLYFAEKAYFAEWEKFSADLSAIGFDPSAIDQEECLGGKAWKYWVRVLPGAKFEAYAQNANGEKWKISEMNDLKRISQSK